MTQTPSFDELMMQEAIIEAQRAYDLGEVPIGAIISCGDTVVGRGHNLRETENDPTAHAEVIAIREASRRLQRWRLTDCTLYVTIEPCPMCAGAIVLARIGRVVYGAADLKAGAVHSLFNIVQAPSLNHTVEVTAGVLEDKCRDLMKDFFRKLRQRGNR